MSDDKVQDKVTGILDYIRSYCKITKYSTENTDNINIEIDYNYHYSMFYDIYTEQLTRIYYGHKVEVVDVTKEFKKHQRKTKLINIENLT